MQRIAGILEQCFGGFPKSQSGIQPARLRLLQNGIQWRFHTGGNVA
jgi:hypothetical protein